jgi:tetratricopeptide (TPR) repeat protein
MTKILLLMLIDNIIWQGIISNVFWLTIFLTAVILFRRELRALLASLASFKIAGASFELKDKKATLESYAILTDILIQVLSQRDSAAKLADLLSDNSVRQLAKFTLKYAKEVPQEDKDIELFKNVALIVGRKGATQEAVSFYDVLLKQTPEDRDLLNLKANMLQSSGVEENMIMAESIYDRLVKMYPNVGVFRFNRALNKSLMGKYDESFNDLSKSLDLEYGKRNPKMLEAIELRVLRDSKPDEFEELRNKLETS